MIPGRAIEPLGDAAVRWRRDRDRDARQLLDALRAHPGVIDAVVTELHACVTFDPERPPEAPWDLEAKIPLAGAAPDPGAREHVVRARYDGPDLDEVAARAGLSRAQAIEAHLERTYVVKLVGFLPGFAYLGPVAPALALPRRAKPRPRVAAGSIGVAGGYRGVYPFASPGGWHVIARAIDFVAFDGSGARLALGDRVRFEAVE
jgi:UPF0271 protein